ncbi:uncharacterized protein LOC134474599 [Cavia porcellus]|uniref:uncharacterized protein LOC134474599 n=1 Tax=Cavia porcellus TaxID=10141 RepID=UPI002FE41C8A
MAGCSRAGASWWTVWGGETLPSWWPGSRERREEPGTRAQLKEGAQCAQGCRGCSPWPAAPRREHHGGRCGEERRSHHGGREAGREGRSRGPEHSLKRELSVAQGCRGCTPWLAAPRQEHRGGQVWGGETLPSWWPGSRERREEPGTRAQLKEGAQCAQGCRGCSPWPAAPRREHHGGRCGEERRSHHGGREAGREGRSRGPEHSLKRELSVAQGCRGCSPWPAAPRREHHGGRCGEERRSHHGGREAGREGRSRGPEHSLKRELSVAQGCRGCTPWLAAPRQEHRGGQVWGGETLPSWWPGSRERREEPGTRTQLKEGAQCGSGVQRVQSMAGCSKAGASWWTGVGEERCSHHGGREAGREGRRRGPEHSLKRGAQCGSGVQRVQSMAGCSKAGASWWTVWGGETPTSWWPGSRERREEPGTRTQLKEGAQCGSGVQRVQSMAG